MAYPTGWSLIDSIKDVQEVENEIESLARRKT